MIRIAGVIIPEVAYHVIQHDKNPVDPPVVSRYHQE
jgi:hypothetical protein